jgi:hypothetical protein
MGGETSRFMGDAESLLAAPRTTGETSAFHGAIRRVAPRTSILLGNVIKARAPTEGVVSQSRSARRKV